MRSLSILVAALLLLAGCASPDDAKTTEPTQDDPVDPGHDEGQDDDHADPGDDGTGDDEGGDEPPAPSPDVPPVLSLSASITEAEVPYTSNVTIDLSDEDSDDPAWIAYLGEDEVASGTGAGYADIDVTEAGEHLLRVVASADGNSTEKNLTLTGIEPPPRHVEVADASDDATGDMFDITKLELELTEAGLEALITLEDIVYPSEKGDSNWWYSIFINEQRYDSELYLTSDNAAAEEHSDLYDYADDIYLGPQYSAWDAEDNTVWILVSYEELEEAGISAPYEVSVASMVSPLTAHDDLRYRDVAPDDGPASIG